MKNKKTILGIIILTIFFGILNLTIPQVYAYTGQYELRTNPSNPFLFSVDVKYTTPNNDIDLDTNNLYHQVFLKEDKYYYFYNLWGFMSLENMRLWIHSAISISIDYYYEYTHEDGMYYPVYISPSETGLYNITILPPFTGSCSFSGIGVFEIPIVLLDTEITREDSIVAGIFELNTYTEYQVGHDETVHGYGGSEFYYANINSLNTYDKLDDSHDVLEYDGYDIITTNNLGYGAGKYIFYSIGYDSFSLMKALDPVSTSKPIINIIINNILIIVVISVIASIVIIPIVIIRKRKKRNSEEVIKPE